jgi:hypothetical protein
MNSFNLSNQGLSFLWQEMRDSAKWEYDAGQNASEQKTRLTIAALESQAAEDDNRRKQLESLGNFAYKIWENF